MIKTIKFQIRKLILKAKMRSVCMEIDAAEMRIAQDNLLIDNLWRYRTELQSESFWLEKNNLELKRMAA